MSSVKENYNNQIDVFKDFVDFIETNNIDIMNLSFIRSNEFSNVRNSLLKALNSKMVNRHRYFISVEGIDATGKGTVSRYLESFLKELDYEAERINIPNYNLGSGKIITNALSTNMTEEELYKRRYEFINHFSVNRYEVNHILRNKQRDWDKHEIIIFDRWINSSIAFSIAKTVLHIDKEINELSEEDLNLIKEAIDYNYNLEVELFENEIIDLELVFTSRIDLIEERIKARNAGNVGIISKDNDIIKDDQHEKNTKLLLTTQEAFISLATGKFGNLNYINFAADKTFVIENNNEIKDTILDCLEKILN